MGVMWVLQQGSILLHTNNTLKILIRGDLSSTDTLLNILKMGFKMAAL